MTEERRVTIRRLGGGRRRLSASTRLPLPPEEVFPFFADAGNLQRITPPELGFEIRTQGPIEMRRGARIDYRLRLAGVPFSWRTEITEWDPPHRFTDSQLAGPYREWVHTHTFREDGDGTVMDDRVVFRLPLWPASELGAPIVALQLRRIFRHRNRRIRSLLVAEAGAEAERG